MMLRIYNVLIAVSVVVIIIGLVVIVREVRQQNALNNEHCPQPSYAVMTPTGIGCATTLHLYFKSVHRPR